MTTERIETYQNDVIVETRDLDLIANTFTRRDAVGTIVEQRLLNARELAQLNAKQARGVRNAAFQQAIINNNASPPTPLRDTLATILDELERLRGRG